MSRIARAILALQIAFAPWANASGPQCDLTSVQPLVQTPYQDCDRLSSTFDHLYQDCVKTPDVLKAGALDDLLVRREQLKFMLSQDLFNASRLPPNVHFYESVWSGLRASWQARLAAQPEVFKIDEDPHLGADRCALHQVLGVDCGGLPALDLIDVQKQRAAQEAQNRAAGRKLPMSLSYDLLQAVLLLESVKGNFMDMFKSSDFKTHQKTDQIEIRNYVYRFYPELALNQNIYNRLFSLGVSTGLVQKIRAQVDVANGAGLSLEKRVGLITAAMTEEFTARPLTDSMQTHLETDFETAQNTLNQTLGAQITRGISDKKWLFNQDYLLLSVMQASTQWQQKKQAPLMQTLICHNYLAEERWETRKQTAELIGGAVVLVTGVGMFFDLAAALGTACVATSFTVLNAMSAVNVYSALRELHSRQDLFAVRGTDFSDVENARTDLKAEIPWAVLNVALMAPPLVLAKVAAARQTAEAAGDLARVAQLDHYRTLIIRAVVATGVGIAGTNSYQAYGVLRSSWNKSAPPTEK